MSARAERLRSLVQRHGEPVTVNGTRTVQAVVFVATSALLRSLFTDNDLLSFNRPMWVGVVAADETLNTGDTVSRDGMTFTVRRVITLSIGSASVVKVAVWSQ